LIHDKFRMNKFNFKEVFYLSNLLSISRIILTLPAIYLIKLNTKSGNIVLLGLGLLLILTDHLDGYFSRKFNQETLLGQLLDPIADKISMGIILLFLLIYRDFPMQLVILIVYRDLLIILIGLFLVRKKNADLRANFYGTEYWYFGLNNNCIPIKHQQSNFSDIYWFQLCFTSYFRNSKFSYGREIYQLS